MAYFLKVYDEDGNVIDDSVAVTNASTVVGVIIDRKLKDGEYSVLTDATPEIKRLVEERKKRKKKK